MYFKEVLHLPHLKISIFMLYLKIINTFLINNVCILQLIVRGTQK